MQEEKKY